MEQIDYAPLIPKEPPEDLVAECIRQGAFREEYLIYRAGWAYEPREERKVPCVDVTCSACGETWKTDRVEADCCSKAYTPVPFGWRHHVTGAAIISGNHTMCPFCGAEAEARHVGTIRDRIKDHAYITQLSRVRVEGKTDRLLLIDWQVRRDTDKDGNHDFSAQIWTAWVVEERKVVRLMGHYRQFNQLISIPLTQRKTFLDDYRRLILLYPYREDVLIGTTAENSALGRYIGAGGKCLVAYLALWKRRPTVENLVMQGYGRLLDELIDKDQTSCSYERHKGIPKLPQIDWKKKKPHEMLHMEKWQFRQLRGRMKKDGLDAVCWADEKGLVIRTPEKLEWIVQKRQWELERLLAKAPDFWRAAKYLAKVSGREIGTLIDYWTMAEKLKMDLEEPCVRFPKDLRRSHDYTVARYNERITEITQAGFREREEQLKQYAYHADGILIRPCATEAELKAEGKALHHCVGTYAQSHAEGKTAIFFVRKESEPDTPWYTLELDEETLQVRQNRGLRNCNPTKDVQDFVVKWLNLHRGKKTKKGEHAA